MLTGQYPLTHGVFVNDVHLGNKTPSIADAFKSAGYDTAYIGKWHVGGRGRSNYIPPEHRQGFDYWKVLECTHDYNNSPYYSGDSDQKLEWEGYDAIAQTRDAQDYIRTHDPTKPFFLTLSWGPPHAPYGTAPEEYRAMYAPEDIELRDNVPDELSNDARDWLAGYYAHCSALDRCMRDLLSTLDATGISDDTLLVFTSDHGDMLGSQGETKKQRPWDESIRVPFLLRYPNMKGWQPRELDAIIDAPDIMPTLLGICNIAVPDSVEGIDFSDMIAGGDDPSDGAALLMCPNPFGQWNKRDHGGREYRGLRTRRYTYTRDLNGPWLLYDNEHDPYQQNNVISDPAYENIREKLDSLLSKRIDELHDDFLPGPEHISTWGYTTDDRGTVPYTG